MGAYTFKPSDSAYGTFDQGGNVWEWNESIIDSDSRCHRGASWGGNATNMSAGTRCYGGPSSEGDSGGFRVARVFNLGFAKSLLSGTWYLRSICTQKNGQPDNFGYDTGVFTFQSNGFFTETMTSQSGSSWGETGTSVAAEDGTVYVLFNNDEAVWNDALNASRDVMVSNSQDDDEFDLDVLVKKGDSYSTINLEGTWYAHGIQTQRDGYPDSFAADSGTFTFQNDGNFVGDWVTYDGNSWTDTGSASVDTNGIVTLTFADGNSAQAALNATKVVMTLNWKLVDAPENELGLDIFVKKGELKGDLNGDGIVNMLDFAFFAGDWLKEIE